MQCFEQDEVASGRVYCMSVYGVPGSPGMVGQLLSLGHAT